MKKDVFDETRHRTSVFIILLPVNNSWILHIMLLA